jgi:hypothetical protein
VLVVEVVSVKTVLVVEVVSVKIVLVVEVVSTYSIFVRVTVTHSISIQGSQQEVVAFAGWGLPKPPTAMKPPTIMTTPAVNAMARARFFWTELMCEAPFDYGVGD